MSQTPEESSKLNRIMSNFLGYGTITFTLLMLLFFLVIPVGYMIMKAFIASDGSFTTEYFTLLFANELQMESIWNSIYIGIATPLYVHYSLFRFRSLTPNLITSSKP